jgi:hypothetical protein
MSFGKHLIKHQCTESKNFETGWDFVKFQELSRNLLTNVTNGYSLEILKYPESFLLKAINNFLLNNQKYPDGKFFLTSNSLLLR